MKKIISVLILFLLIGCAKPVEEEAPEPEAAAEEEAAVEKEPEPEPVVVLRKGFITEHEGRNLILVDVSPQETFCRIRVDEETLTITTGTERSALGLTIRVLKASVEPKKTCEVEIR
ncbi:hypothetical protein KY360_02675 [Candidatus Woesearchaeota archaeon]|nr:hypothetical protein [Candidatus Woesearchaeota archaeon]